MSLFAPDNTFFVSDTHWGHRGVLDSCKRPFADVNEMNDYMVQRWNETVPKDGHVFHTGDVSFMGKNATRELLSRLNGRIYLCRGNHDKGIKGSFALEMFEWVKDVYMLKVKDPDVEGGIQRIFLSHYAHRIWDRSHYGVWHLYGHSHGSLPAHGKSIDVGVDSEYCIDFAPITYSHVKSIMSNRGIEVVDHHELRK